MADSESGNFIPVGGTFAVLTIDPVGSVDYLEDPEATAASMKLVSKDYVICAPAFKPMFNPSAAFRKEFVFFVQQGTPHDFPAQLIDASMSIPIAPQTCSVDNHPSKREPVKMVSNPFPFSDCYLSAFVTADVRTANVVVFDSIICELNDEDKLRVKRLTNEDFELRLDRLEEQQRETEGAVTDEGEKREISSEHYTEQDAESETENKVQNDGPADPVEAETTSILHGLLLSQPSDELPAVKFSYDLSRVAEINHPRDFWHEVEKIAEIVQASKARREVQKTTAAEKDAARYDDLTADLLHAHKVQRTLSNGIKRLVQRRISGVKRLIPGVYGVFFKKIPCN
ncbi:hypothetical protein MIND_01357900 [Mycena indigotica]|uniref:Uncharacterized protein n=1 Tax=Mycena indigotica TaxID=2126181 RepID=A0A8H6RZG2_9AGAR|nr:uncharacterized protein MIND_01357900 [Mycena indigotica]KAF7289836.1 hypothetical protein MIND_01357900 [Mycena indigotica]